MEAVIREQVQDEDVDAVEEIVLDEWKGTVITPRDKSVLERYSSLNFLSLQGVGLTSLSNFPALGSLLKLDLSKNGLTGGLDSLEQCQELMQLNLSENDIKTIEALRPLNSLPNLLSLDLLDNPVTEVEGYREKVFDLCSSLEVLDGLNVEGQEVSLSEEEGSDEDFSPESDVEEVEEEDEDESYDSEEDRPKRRKRGNEEEAQPRKQHKK